MKTSKLKNVCIPVLAAVLLCLASCAKNPGVQGGDFAEQSSLSDVFSTDGNTTISLSGDETMDLTGIRLIGRKEIYLNDCTLRLIGEYAVTQEGVIDIKPAEGSSTAAIDLSGLQFDLSNAPAQNELDLPVIEIRSGVTILEPSGNDRIGVRDYGVLTEIHVKYSD